jgi:hypothetical protein
MLDAVFLAESADHANWKTLSELVSSVPAGDVQDAFRAAVDVVEEQEDEHLEWASSTKLRMVKLQATSARMARIGAVGEEFVARVKEWFAE